MEFLKNHYEKVLLAVVLIGLAVVVIVLPMKIPEPPNLQAQSPKAPTPVNLTTNDEALAMLSHLPPVVLSGTNNLFNPVIWRRIKDREGNLIMVKIVSDNMVGPGAVVYERPIPRYFTISFDGVSGENYAFGVTHDEAKLAKDRAKKTFYVKLHEATDAFTLLQVNGPPDNPTDVVIQLADTKERVTIAKDKPYRRVGGYDADLKYAPFRMESIPFPDQKVGSTLRFDEDTNIVVDITSNTVVLSAKSTGKRTTIKLNAAP